MTDTLTGHDVEEGELPSGWAVSRLGDLAGLGPKVPAEVLEANDELSFVPMAAVTEVSGEVDLTQTITAQEGKKRSLKYFADGDVIFAKITPCMENGKVARPSGLTNGAAFGSTEFHVLRPTPAIDGDFLRFVLVHDDFRYEAERAMTGAVGQRRVPKKYLEDFPLPTPPLEEQGRIVEILGEQLSRLDTAVGSVQVVREKAAQFRRSLLHAAFTGALTGHDVEEGELPSGWALCKFNEIANVDSNLVDPKPLGHLPHIAPNNIEGDSGRLLDYRSTAEDGVTSGKHKFHRGHILYSKIRPYLNKVVVVDFEGLCSADMYPISTDQNTNWLFMTMLSPSFVLQTSSTQTRTVLPKINIKELSRIEIPVPPLPEQGRIVEILEDQLSRLDASLAVADAVEERSAALRRSLLHSAFTGRLTREWREAVNV